MPTKYAGIGVRAVALAGCSAVGQLTVKDYRAKSGDRVMAGHKGNMDKAGAMQRATAAAVEAAPGRGANYAYVIAPGEASIGGINVNAFKDAQVVYYKCASLPAAQ